MHGRIIDAGLGVLDLEVFPVQGRARFTGPAVQCGDVFIFVDAGGLIGGLVSFGVEMCGFCPDQAFGGLVGLAHFGGYILRHSPDAFPLHDALCDRFPDVEQKGLFVLP